MKHTLSIAELDSQTALELPNRDMMALLNVVIVDFIDIGQLNVQVPIGVAANVCDVNAAVLIAQIQDFGSAECTATNETVASNGPGERGGARQ